ncbi:hypothetical protein B4110_3556 [Parageobacillus toebii]|uniref:Uncharacterized protein n=1 Tax=Parageobacillus toebii TaxID=153151 RepID=A0A150N8P2_9BACL|nr:hypothetical protein B4110_3556 [Parageobacillus toebii]
MVFYSKRKKACTGRFFAFKAILAFFFPQRCNERLPGVAPHGCGMNRLTPASLSEPSAGLRRLQPDCHRQGGGQRRRPARAWGLSDMGGLGVSL